MPNSRRLAICIAVLGAVLAAACESVGEPDEAALTTTLPATTQPATTQPATTDAPEPDPSTPIEISYGDAPQQVGDLWLPAAIDTPIPVVVLVHGGFWRNRFGSLLMTPLAADLVERGYAVWNLEYRRLGDAGGGWPGTLDDVASGVDAVAGFATTYGLDLDRLAVVGHSSGGHLALWASGRSSLPADAPGADPIVMPAVAIGQGAIVDLVGAADAGLRGGAVAELLGGGPDEFPDRYEVAMPALDGAAELVSVVGSADVIVPERFSVDPNDALDLVVVDGADHFALIDPNHPAWDVVVDVLAREIGGSDG